VTPTLAGRVRLALTALLLAVAAALPPAHAQEPNRYRFSFPEPHHHWMQVDASFGGLDASPLELRMSRASPGRYALHDFAKNVYDVRAVAPDGSELALTRPDPYGWTVPAHGASLSVTYKVFGDLVDGTYLGIDSTHAHINMPAVIMWARGQDDRPATISLVEPVGASWLAATQLHPGSSPLEFTAPNLQYLMDSPVEFGPVSIRLFTVDGHRFRVALHQDGAEADLDAFVGDVERVVRTEEAIYGELPAYEPGAYTFLADYLPYVTEDGMEHRNSTVMTSTSSLRTERAALLDTVAHEFFHSWNVERIRPRSLEPFAFERANMSGELWLAEGFTEYYGPLALARAGLTSLATTTARMARFVESVASSPGRLVRSAEEMSRMAPFTDGGSPIDRTNWSSTVISYYDFGGAIALALDLTLRERSAGQLTLDDYMRALWRVHGRPGGSREGYVDRPYTMADAEARLSEVSGDAAFAHEFFGRYIQGHDVADYERLLDRAGLVLRRRSPWRAWWGEARVAASRDGVRLESAPLFGTPLYVAGLDVGDDVRQIDGSRVMSADAVRSALARHRPGERIGVSYVERAGLARNAVVTLAEDPSLDLTPVESMGKPLTAAQKMFRDRWLGPAAVAPSR
jgi:predicted metalloprotease with PDZ domain